MNILCIGTMTLYFRSIWPVARKFIENGHSIYIKQHGKFSEELIRKQPKGVNVIDKDAICFICDIINLDYKFINKINWIDEYPKYNISKNFIYTLCSVISKRKPYDIILSVHKCLPELRQFSYLGDLLVALPYAPIPDLYIFNNSHEIPDIQAHNNVDFFEYMRNVSKAKFYPSGLPFADSLVWKRKKITKKNTNKLLFLHPGGFRGVVSNEEDDENVCLSKQIILYNKILALLPQGFSLGIKIHPLAAKWHDEHANNPLCRDLGIQLHGGGWPGNYIFEYDAILSLGSTTIYENIGTDIPFFVLGFIGGSRQILFKKLTHYYINSPKELHKKLNNLEKYSKLYMYDELLSAFGYEGNNTEAIVKNIYEHKKTMRK